MAPIRTIPFFAFSLTAFTISRLLRPPLRAIRLAVSTRLALFTNGTLSTRLAIGSLAARMAFLSAVARRSWSLFEAFSRRLDRQASQAPHAMAIKSSFSSSGVGVWLIFFSSCEFAICEFELLFFARLLNVHNERG